MLMKQGMQIFKRPEIQTQFAFNKGVLFLAQHKFDESIQQFLQLYENVCSKIKVRPPAQRIEGTNLEETQKFSILQNLILAYVMRE